VAAWVTSELKTEVDTRLR